MFKVGGHVIVRPCCFIRLYLLVSKATISLEGDHKTQNRCCLETTQLKFPRHSIKFGPTFEQILNIKFKKERLLVNYAFSSTKNWKLVVVLILCMVF